MDCPEPSQIAKLVNGIGSTLDLQELEQHLYGCAGCASVVASAMSASWASRSMPAEGTTTVGQPPSAPATGAPTQGVIPMLRPGFGMIPAGTPLGRYRVRRWLGRGGMGEVYEGYDPELERRVALKVLRSRAPDDQPARRRLSREAKALARLSSPNVVGALDVGVFGAQLFLVMELVEGPTLASWLLLKPHPWREVVDMFLAAGEGLAAAHEVGVIHRDFKPQNVLIGADGKPRVGDFGLARESETEAATTGATDTAVAPDDEARPDTRQTNLTQTGMVMGTPRYMAPEQFLRRPLDARVDQFSFCVALYEAIYGAHPFLEPSPSGHIRWRPRKSRAEPKAPSPDGPAESESLDTLRTAVLAGRPSQFPSRKHAPRALAAVLRRGLARDPAQRFPTFRDLLTALRRAKTGPRRRLAFAAAAAVVAVVGCAAAAAAWYQSHRQSEIDFVQPTGDPADWSGSRVLARVNDEVHCIQRLDDRTLRIVWGNPHQAEDIDLPTGGRRPSPLVPESYRAGCPALSPDGRQLLFEGYDSEGRPHIFHAGNNTGEGAKPVTSCAKPSLNSEPRWLSSNREFVFDADLVHAAVFSLQTGTFAVVPGPESKPGTPAGTFFKAVGSDDRIVVTQGQFARQIILKVYRWPGLAIESSLAFSGAAETAWIPGATHQRLLGGGVGLSGDLIAMVDRHTRRLTLLASIANRAIHSFERVAGQLAFVTEHVSSAVWQKREAGDPGDDKWILQEDAGHLEGPSVTSRGDVLLTRGVVSHYRAVLLNLQTHVVTPVSDGPDDTSVAALPNDEWIVGRNGPPGSEFNGVLRCGNLYSEERLRCRRIGPDVGLQVSASPDGKLLAYTSTSDQGLGVSVMSTDGGPSTIVARDATLCRPVWSGERTLWVSQAVAGKASVWTEFAVGAGPTGRSTPGSSNCFTLRADPLAPDSSPIRIVTSIESEVRLHPEP